MGKLKVSSKRPEKFPETLYVMSSYGELSVIGEEELQDYDGELVAPYSRTGPPETIEVTHDDE